MYHWKPGMVEFMKDAAEYNGFHHVIAERIAAYLPHEGHLCDAGCGMGYLSMALSKNCSQVTAIDVCAKPLETLKSNAAKLKQSNIQVLQGDLFEHEPISPYDAMVFCFFGGTLEALKTAQKQCKGTVVMVKRNWSTRRFALKKTEIERHTFDKSKIELQQRGIPFKEEVLSLEMGQPFRTLESAVDFFKLYASDSCESTICKDEIIEKLVPVLSDDYAYYLPMKREVGMLVIQITDLPAL